MRAYMKSAMPYLGVRVPVVRTVTRAALKTHPISSVEALVDTAHTLWDEAEFREERYAATALLGAPAVRSLRGMSLLPLYRTLIVSGGWWDHVDELSHRVGELLVLDRLAMTPTLRAWAVDTDIWLRRSAIIAQLGAKQSTDLDLLTYAIEASIGEREFFLRKAIGWALREYARTDPGWVREFVAEHPDLSPLSQREALKHL